MAFSNWPNPSSKALEPARTVTKGLGLALVSSLGHANLTPMVAMEASM